MARPKTTTLFEDGKKKTSWTISSTAPLHLIFLPLRIAGKPPKHLSKDPHWDGHTTKELIFEGWDRVSQDFINEKCRSMAKRLRDVIDGEGKMTGW